MTKDTIKTDEAVNNPSITATMAEIATIINRTEPVAGTPLTGIETMRQDDPDALVIWSVKGPKSMSESLIQAVLVNGAVVLIHQMESGRFKVYRA